MAVLLVDVLAVGVVGADVHHPLSIYRFIWFHVTLFIVKFRLLFLWLNARNRQNRLAMASSSSVAATASTPYKSDNPAYGEQVPAVAMHWCKAAAEHVFFF